LQEIDGAGGKDAWREFIGTNGERKHVQEYIHIYIYIYIYIYIATSPATHTERAQVTDDTVCSRRERGVQAVLKNEGRERERNPVTCM
jgi:hypothetical protein